MRFGRDYQQIDAGNYLLTDPYGASQEVLNSFTATIGRKILVLGDMGEIGEASGQYHDEIGGYAKSQGVDLLFGIGYKLNEIEDYKNAKGCFAMAAPDYTRAFCYLSTTTDQETDKPKAERDRESFNYIAYSASQNDWCAEYGMYATYWFGDKDIPKDRDLALRWLEHRLAVQADGLAVLAPGEAVAVAGSFFGLGDDDREWLRKHCNSIIHSAAILEFFGKDRAGAEGTVPRRRGRSPQNQQPSMRRLR